MYATGGRGTEPFIAAEIREKLFTEEKETCRLSDTNFIDVRDGKVFFNIYGDIENQIKNVLKLKCPERVFVAIKDYDAKVYLCNKRVFLNKLMPEMSNCTNYKFAQKVLTNSFNHQNNISRKEKKISNQNGTPQYVLKRPCANDINNAVCDKKSKPNVVHNVETSSNVNVKPCDIIGINEELSSENKKQNDLPSSYPTPYDNYTDVLLCKERLHECHLHETGNMTFRMSIKCTGKARRMLNIERLSRDLAWRVSKASGWSSNVRSPLFEVCVHISESHVTAGIPLTRIPISKRDYIIDSGLRAPVAWIMYHLAEIKEDDRVLDPMCGKGTLLLEACSEEKNAVYLGVDNNLAQISTAVTNVQTAKFTKSIQFLIGDCLKLPFEKEYFDAVLCDAPFDQKHVIYGNSKEFYLKFLAEINRVLRRQGRCVLLTSEALKATVLSLLSENEVSSCPDETSLQESASNQKGSTINFHIVSQHYIKLGETHACILVMNKK